MVSSRSELTHRQSGKQGANERATESPAVAPFSFRGRSTCPHCAEVEADSGVLECGCLVTPALSPTGGHSSAGAGKKGGSQPDWLDDVLFDSDVFFAEARRAAMEGRDDEAEALFVQAQARMATVLERTAQL